MRDSEIAQFLYRMAECVAEVEQATYTVVKLVLLYHIALYLNTTGNHGLTVKRQGVQGIVEAGVEYHTIFDDLGTAVTIDFWGKGIHQCRIAADKRGLVETAHKVLACRDIDCSLATHRAVHRRKQCRRHLHILHTTQVERCGKTAKVAHHSTAKGHNSITAGQLGRCHEVEECQQVVGTF